MNPAASALLAETRRTPGRVLLTGLAVLVATVFAAGTLLLSDTLRATVTEGAARTPEAAAFALSQTAFEADDVDRALAVPGVTGAVPLVYAYQPVRGGGLSGTWQIVSDPMSGPLTRLSALTAGALPTGPDEVLVDADTAERAGLAPGDTVGVLLSGEDGEQTTRELTVTGVVPDVSSGIDTLVAAPGTVFALGGFADQIDIAGTPAAEALAAAFAGDGSTLRTAADQRAYEVQQASESVTAVLVGVSVFVAVALIAAVVVVASTFRIVLSRRRTQLALLRCVGASRGQVTGAVLAEAAVTGLVAGVAGVAVAVGLGYATTGVLRAFGMGSATLAINGLGLLGCVLLALVATLAAAVVPAIGAGRVPPVAALSSAATSDGGEPRVLGRVVLALVCLTPAVLLAVVALSGGLDSMIAVAAVALSGLLVFAALVALGPLLVGGLARTVGALIAATGPAGRMAVANARQVPRRTAATITVLSLGVGLTSALLVGIAGVQADAEASIAEQFPAAVQVTYLGESDEAELTALAGRLDAEPELVASAAAGNVNVDPAAGVTDEAMRAALERTLGPESTEFVRYAADQRAEIEQVVGLGRAIGFGLVGMTLLVAVVGVGVTLMLSVTERTRETGLLRAVGLTRSGTHRMVASEAALGGIAAGVIGAVIGAVYGILAQTALGFGFGVTVPAAQLIGLVAGVVLVAVVAAIAPAARAGRVSPTQALAEA